MHDNEIEEDIREAFRVFDREGLVVYRGSVVHFFSLNPDAAASLARGTMDHYNGPLPYRTGAGSNMLQHLGAKAPRYTTS